MPSSQRAYGSDQHARTVQPQCKDHALAVQLFDAAASRAE